MTPTARSLIVNWTLVALAACSLVVIVATRRLPTSSQLEARRRHLLARFEEDAVDRIRFTGATELTIVRADDPRFRITAPVEAAAEEATVDRLLRDLRFATYIRRLSEADIDRKRMGLEPPSLTLEVAQGPLVSQLALGGDATSPAGARYVEVREGGRSAVFVVGPSTAQDLAPAPADFRIQRLLPVRESELFAIELSKGGRRVRLERKRTWRFAGAYGDARLDPAVMDRLFVQFARPGGEDFVDIESARSEQRRAPTLLSMVLLGKGEGERSEVSIGGQCPRRERAVLAVRETPEPIAACIESDLEAAFIERPELLLDRSPFTFRADEVDEIQIEGNGSRLDVARKGDGFVMREPRTGEVERRAGIARLEALLGARGEWLDPSTAEGPFVPVAKATLTRGAARDEDRLSETVELGTLGQLERVARRGDDGAYLLLDAESARAFRVDALMLRSRTVLELDADELERVDVRWASGHQRLRQSDRGVFALEAPSGFEVDPGLAADLLATLQGLRAEEWVSEEVGPGFGLEEPAIVCTLTPKGARSPVVLELGSAAPGGAVYATLDRRGVFTLPRSVREALTTWVVDRSPFILDTESLERLELVARDRRLELRRLGSSFVQSSAGTATTASKVTELLDAFTMLRAEGLVSLDTPTPVQGSLSPTLEITATVSPGPGMPPEVRRLTVGTRDTFGETSIYYAWLHGVTAVYALPREGVRRILDLW